MPPATDGDVAVVRPYYVIEDAYKMGYRRFEEVEGEEAEDFDFEPFTQSAEWANTVLPKLRAMAGFADAGHGTYQEDRQIAAVHPGCEEDEPAEADLSRAHHLHQTLVDAYSTGAYDAAEGRDPDADRAPSW